MKTEFIEIDQEEIQKDTSGRFREDTHYFRIIKNGENAGMYGIIDRNNTIAETFLMVFEGFRYKIINRDTMSFIINQPFLLGFRQNWSWTRWPSWIKLLKRFESQGVEGQLLPPPWDNDLTKIWFRKMVPNV